MQQATAYLQIRGIGDREITFSPRNCTNVNYIRKGRVMKTTTLISALRFDSRAQPLNGFELPVQIICDQHTRDSGVPSRSAQVMSQPSSNKESIPFCHLPFLCVLSSVNKYERFELLRDFLLRVVHLTIHAIVDEPV